MIMGGSCCPGLLGDMGFFNNVGFFCVCVFVLSGCLLFFFSGESYFDSRRIWLRKKMC